ncbi:MAG: hypothetical protein WCK37_04760 [Candidatus Falkowbacteria bacterium]
MLFSSIILVQGDNATVIAIETSLLIIKEVMDYLHDYDKEGVIESILVRGNQNIVKAKLLTKNKVEEILSSLYGEKIETIKGTHCIIDFGPDKIGLEKIMAKIEQKESFQLTPSC